MNIISEMSNENISLSSTKQFITAHRGFVISSYQYDDQPAPSPNDHKTSTPSICSTSSTVRIATLCQFHEHMGVGQVQYLIWALSVVLSYAGNAELLTLSLVMPYIRCQWKFSAAFEGIICIVLFLSYSVISDVAWWLLRNIMRKKLLMISSIAIIISITITSVSNNVWVFVVTRAVIGCSVGLSMTTLRRYTEEFTPRAKLPLVTVLLETGGLAAAFLITIQALILLNTIGWRLYLMIHTVPHFVALAILLYTPESLEFLLERGETEKLNTMLHDISSRNRVTLEGIEVNIRPVPNFRHHYGKEIKKNIFSLSVFLFGNICADVGVFYLFPPLLTSHYCNAQFFRSHSRNHMCVIAQHNFHKIMLLALVGGGALVISVLTMDKIRPVVFFQLSAVAIITALVAVFFCDGSNYYTLIPPLVMKFSQQVGATICRTSFPDFFPMSVRREMEVIANTIGKLGSIFGSSLIFFLFYGNPYSVLGTFTAIQIVSLFACFAVY